MHYYLLMFWVITRLTPLRTEFISFTHDPSAGLALCKADTFQSYLFHLHSHPQAHDAIQGHPQCWKNNLIPVYLSYLNVKSAHSFWSPFDHKGLEVELLYLAITGTFRAGRLPYKSSDPYWDCLEGVPQRVISFPWEKRLSSFFSSSNLYLPSKNSCWWNPGNLPVSSCTQFLANTFILTHSS